MRTPVAYLVALQILALCIVGTGVDTRYPTWMVYCKLLRILQCNGKYRYSINPKFVGSFCACWR
jgi:hypothetical protein